MFSQCQSKVRLTFANSAFDYLFISFSSFGLRNDHIRIELEKLDWIDWIKQERRTKDSHLSLDIHNIRVKIRPKVIFSKPGKLLSFIPGLLINCIAKTKQTKKQGSEKILSKSFHIWFCHHHQWKWISINHIFFFGDSSNWKTLIIIIMDIFNDQSVSQPVILKIELTHHHQWWCISNWSKKKVLESISFVNFFKNKQPTEQKKMLITLNAKKKIFIQFRCLCFGDSRLKNLTTTITNYHRLQWQFFLIYQSWKRANTLKDHHHLNDHFHFI